MKFSKISAVLQTVQCAPAHSDDVIICPMMVIQDRFPWIIHYRPMREGRRAIILALLHVYP